MSKTFRTNILSVSGRDMVINPLDTATFWRHDGTFAPPTGFITSGQTGNFVTTSQTGNFITTSQTGAFGGGSTPTGNLTGVFYPLNNNPSGYLRSGDLGTGTTLGFDFGYVQVSSGSQQSQFIPFHQNFISVPNVYGQLINNSGDSLVAYCISGRSISGFYLNFSDSLTTNNYFYDFFATTGSGLYSFALSLITTQANIFSQGTITGVGTRNFITKFTTDGSGITNSQISENATGVYITGNLIASGMTIPNGTIRIKDGQLQSFDLAAWSGDPTMPWRALGVNNGLTIWSDPILD